MPTDHTLFLQRWNLKHTNIFFWPYIDLVHTCHDVRDWSEIYTVPSPTPLTDFEVKVMEIFHGPVILPCILKTIWCMNIMLWGYVSVWPDIWPQNKCTSLWPIFHGPVILPYIWKPIWCMNIILCDYESAWHIWPQNKCRSLWPIFHGPVTLPYIL